jgi:hypothetical protein
MQPKQIAEHGGSSLKSRGRRFRAARGLGALGEIQECFPAMPVQNTQTRQLTTQTTTDAKIKCAFQRNLASEHTKREPDTSTIEHQEDLTQEKQNQNLKRHKKNYIKGKTNCASQRTVFQAVVPSRIYSKNRYAKLRKHSTTPSTKALWLDNKETNVEVQQSVRRHKWAS